MPKHITIFLNGRPKRIASSLKLKKAIDSFQSNSRHTIAEVNGAIIKRSQWVKYILKENDQLELVSIVGGG